MNAAEAIERAGSLVDLVADSASVGERDRRVPQPVIEAVASQGLFEIAVPSSLGGHGLDLRTLGDVTRILGQGCPATAWTTSFLMLHAWLLSKLPAPGRDEVFAGTPAPLAAAPLAPTGRAVPVDGGFVVHGRWEWATASAHASWVLVHAIEEAVPMASRFAVLPMEEVTVDDVWFTSGMRATGSNAIEVIERFVPAERTIPARELLDSSSAVPGDGLAGLPVASVLSLVAAAPALGAAERAAELYRERLHDRVLAYSVGDKAAEQAPAQVRLATVLDTVRCARARWDQAVGSLWSHSAPSDAVRADVRLAAASVVRASRLAITTACDGAGASVYFDTHPLQRIQRDVETLKGHVLFDWDRTAELAGRVSLGLGLRPSDLV